MAKEPFGLSSGWKIPSAVRVVLRCRIDQLLVACVAHRLGEIAGRLRIRGAHPEQRLSVLASHPAGRERVTDFGELPGLGILGLEDPHVRRPSGAASARVYARYRPSGDQESRSRNGVPIVELPRTTVSPTAMEESGGADASGSDAAGASATRVARTSFMPLRPTSVM